MNYKTTKRNIENTGNCCEQRCITLWVDIKQYMHTYVYANVGILTYHFICDRKPDFKIYRCSMKWQTVAKWNDDNSSMKLSSFSSILYTWPRPSWRIPSKVYNSSTPRLRKLFTAFLTVSWEALSAATTFDTKWNMHKLQITG